MKAYLRSQVGWRAILLLGVALIPRLYALGPFLTIDELKWAEGAAQFLQGLYTGDLFLTYWHFFPGVTISWGGAAILGSLCGSAADLIGCANEQVADLDQSIGWLRLTPVLMTSGGIVGLYLLSRHLVDEAVALLAALLLACDPFFVAHSRILNGDAVTAILLFLSLLAFVQIIMRPSPRPLFSPMVILSAILAGLALLTKLPAPLIGVFIIGLGMVIAIREKQFRYWGLVLGIWGGVALLTFILFWPAMWVAPFETLALTYRDSFEVGEVGEGHDTFFLGTIVSDPGWRFYPYAIAFRLTPITILGLLCLIVWGTILFLNRQAEKFSIHQTHWKVALVSAAFILFLILFANLSPKKLDRYVMAVIPALIFLAAMGWVKIWQRFGKEGLWNQAVLALIVGGQLWFTWRAAPYYLTYYNPLLGGMAKAAQKVPVGWGEGLEQAANYLNRLPEAESLAVSSWYSDIFQPYFVGQRASFSDDGRAQLGADYVVFYINQLQRQKPYPGLLDYFRENEPVFTVEVNEVDWVEVYQAPAAQTAGGTPTVEGIAQLLAYKVEGSANEQQPTELKIGHDIHVSLFLRVLGPLPEDTTLGVQFTSIESNPLQAETIGWQGTWQEGQIVTWQAQLDMSEEITPGRYQLAVTFQFRDGKVIAEFPISEQDPLFQIGR